MLTLMNIMLLYRLIYVNMKDIIQDTMYNWKIYVFLLQTFSCLFCLSSERLEQAIKVPCLPNSESFREI